jgi:hypothetical protein
MREWWVRGAQGAPRFGEEVVFIWCGSSGSGRYGKRGGEGDARSVGWRAGNGIRRAARGDALADWSLKEMMVAGAW